jgi:hypothetical protein
LSIQHIWTLLLTRVALEKLAGYLAARADLDIVGHIVVTQLSLVDGEDIVPWELSDEVKDEMETEAEKPCIDYS